MGISATHRRKVLRDIGSRKGRTALVAISIFVGVLGVVTLMTVNDLFVTQLEEDLKPSEIAMLNGWMGVPRDVDTASIDDNASLAAIRNYPTVTKAEGWSGGRVFWQTDSDDSFIESQIRASATPIMDVEIEPVTLMEGSFPVEGANEIAIERQMAERYDLGVGDTINVRILSQLQGDGTIPIEQWTVSGILFHPYSFEGASTMYARQDDMQYISDSEGLSFIQVRFNKMPTDEEVEAFKEYLADTTPYELRGIEMNDPNNNRLLEEIRQWGNTLTILAMIAMLVASFLVVTVINSILTEQRRQIGVMKSLGASTFDNFSIFTTLALTYGLIGSIPGVLLGIPAGYALTQTLAALANIYIRGFSVSIIAVVVGFVMGLGVPLIAASIPIYRGTRVTILSAMTDLGLSSRYGRGIWARLINWLPVPPNVRQGLANLSQQKGRFFLTGLTLTLAAGAFMGVSAVFVSMGDLIENAFSTYNLAVIVEPDEVQDFDTISHLISNNLDNVKAVHGTYDYSLEVVMDDTKSADGALPAPPPPGLGESLYINGFDPHSNVIQINLSAGTAWENDPQRSGVVLTELAAERLHVGLGDTLTLKQDDRTYPLEVIGIDKFPFERGYMRWDELASIVENKPESEVVPDEFWVQLKNEDATAADADRTIGDLRELLLSNGITANFYNQIADEEAENQTVLTVGLVFNIASSVMAAIGAIGLLASLSISVYERQREIGVMRSVGATTLNIIGQFLTEGLLVGMIAWVIGIPLSILVSIVLGDALPIEFDLAFPPSVLIYGLVGALILAFISSLYPSIIASRKTVSDILRYQ